MPKKRKKQPGSSFYLLTLGCPKNVYDSEGISEMLLQADYNGTDDPSRADVLIVNTCGFLQAAKDESIEALQRKKDIRLDPPDARRNLVTSGVPLNHLVGAEFRVGEVLFRGIRLCEPCRHLEKLTEPGVLSGLIHRGGLLAAVLNEGVIRKGDPIILE